MTLFGLTLAYLRRRPLTLALNVVLVGLGVGTLVLLLLLAGQSRDVLMRDARGIGLVVAAEGSPMQAILSSIYGLDAPVGNVDVRDVRRAVRSRGVREAIPLALGDTYRGFGIVGTTPAYAEHYGAELERGAWWRQPLEVTVGATVADQTGLEVGDTFASAHGVGGLVHDERPMRVVGVARPTGTVLDRRILTSLETVWEIHSDHDDDHHHGGDHGGERHDHDGDEHHDHDTSEPTADEPPASATGEGRSGRPGGAPPVASDDWLALPGGPDDRQVTAVLLTFDSPVGASLLDRSIDALPDVQAASPAFEIARLSRLLGGAFALAQAFGSILGVAAVLTLFVTLYAALRERRYDLALLRAIGVGRGRLLAHVLLEGLVVAAAGLLLGLLVGHSVAGALGAALEADRGVSVTGWAWHPLEGWLVAATLGAGLLAAALPAWQAYRTEVALALSEGG